MAKDFLTETLHLTKTNWGTARILDYSGVEVPPNPGHPRVEVTAEKVQDAPLRFRGKRVTVLNFASGVNPGGGVRYGAVAQEEDLCRCSGLLHGLESLPEFFEMNRNRDAPPECYDRMIVSEDVPLVRDGEGNLIPTMPIQVITYPAPNLFCGIFGEAPPDPDFFPEGHDGDIKPSDVKHIFDRRCPHILHQASALETDVLILGAWGCGAYGNDPGLVAEAFKRALVFYGGGIPQVVFACYGASENRDTFHEVFNQS